MFKSKELSMRGHHFSHIRCMVENYLISRHIVQKYYLLTGDNNNYSRPAPACDILQYDLTFKIEMLLLKTKRELIQKIPAFQQFLWVYQCCVQINTPWFQSKDHHITMHIPFGDETLDVWLIKVGKLTQLLGCTG